jgi:uncharacterized protein (DUF488 family)
MVPPVPTRPPATIYTAGYGARPPSQLVALLRAAGVRCVVDVRLRPDRARIAPYKRARDAGAGIEQLFAGAGIAYRSLPELGNLFLECDDWRPRYAQLVARSGDLLLARLAGTPEPYCLLCAEEDPAQCHRGVLAERLERDGAKVVHLR